MKAIEKCLNRFDLETKTVFLDLYTKVDAEAYKHQAEERMPDADEFSDMIAMLAEKYKTPVSITKNEAKKCYIVEAFDRPTEIHYDQIAKAKSPMFIFDETVAKHQFLVPDA
jgi:hypothetical protein